MLTIAQAFANYKAIIAESDIDMSDNIALCEGWNDYTDLLCKDGELTNLQYHYCPAYDDSMPHDDLDDSDIEYILQAMGVRFKCLPIGKRHDSLMSDMPGASHWLCKFERDGKCGFDLEFTQGVAHKSSPDELTVLGCIMSDLVDESEFTESDFDYWCDSLGFESDSRKAESIYRACIEQSKSVRDCFSATEIDDLRELLSGAGY